MKALTKKQASKIAKFETMSARIRFLTSLGYTRVEIKNHLKIKYQWVRNVQLSVVKKAKES